MTPSVEHWAALEAAETVSETALAYLASFFTDAMVDRQHDVRLPDADVRSTRCPLPRFHPSSGAVPGRPLLRHQDQRAGDVHRPAGASPSRTRPSCSRRRFTAPASAVRRRPILRLTQGCSRHSMASTRRWFATGGSARSRTTRMASPRSSAGTRSSTSSPTHTPAKRHASWRCLRALAGSAARIRVVDENIYALLCNPHVSEVCGISSCAVYEAEYFGKAVTFLSDSRMHLATEHDEPESRRFVAVYDAFLMPGFWREILASVCAVAPDATSLCRARRAGCATTCRSTGATDIWTGSGRCARWARWRVQRLRLRSPRLTATRRDSCSSSREISKPVSRHSRLPWPRNSPRNDGPTGLTRN